ncbi:MAG: hypothetical protein ACLT61_10800 [Anaerostipes hadrus]
MRFVVILKQIPDDSIKDEYQDVDQLNDSDKNVIKEALDLRDRYGGTVDVIGFGPLSAEDVMKETLTYGIDDAFLIGDSTIRRYGCITGSQDRRSGDQKAWSI